MSLSQAFKCKQHHQNVEGEKPKSMYNQNTTNGQIKKT